MDVRAIAHHTRWSADLAGALAQVLAALAVLARAYAARSDQPRALDPYREREF